MSLGLEEESYFLGGLFAAACDEHGTVLGIEEEREVTHVFFGIGVG